MIKKHLHKYSREVSLVILTLFLSLTILPRLTHSQEQVSCPDFTVQQINQAKQTFYDNLQNLVSDSTPASTNLNLIFEDYRNFLSRASLFVQDNSTNINDSGNVLSGPEAQKCKEILQVEKQTVQTTLNNTLKASIYGKQSFNLSEKYSQINQQFNDLNTETNQVTQKVKSFSQQLPCYSRACVQD